MTTFLNIDFDEKLPLNYLQKHILYSFLWLVNFCILILRIDAYYLDKFYIYKHYFSFLMPLALILLNIFVMIKQKWYYNLALMFYPGLIIVWFLPKLILKNGKLYLLLYYIKSITSLLTRFKQVTVQFSIAFVLILLLNSTGNSYVRIISVFYFSFIFLKIMIRYIKGSYDEYNTKSTGKDNKSMDSLNKIDLTNSVESTKADEKLSQEEVRIDKIQTIVLWKSFLDYVIQNVNGTRGKRAFLIVWFFDYFLYLTLTLVFFTFINYQIFKIEPDNYLCTSKVNVFDFFYYTFKTITFSNIDYLKPLSTLARTVEILSYLILCFYFIIITASSIFSLNLTDYTKNMESIVTVCSRENDKLTEHLRANYNTDISNVLKEIETISNSTLKLKKTLERFL